MNRRQPTTIFVLLVRPTRRRLRQTLPGHDPGRLVIDWLLSDLRGYLHRLSVPQNFEFNFFVQLDLRNQVAQFWKTFHVATIELANHVALLQLCFGCGRSWHDFIDNRPLRFSVTLPRLKCARENAEISANDSALLQQTFERSANSVRWNGKANPLRTAAARNDRGVNANDFAAEVDQRAAAISGINGRIGLQQIAENVRAIRPAF